MNPYCSTSLTRREVIWVCLFIAFIVLVSHGRGLVSKQLAMGADASRSSYPIRHHFWTMVAHGELPTWSPTIMGGYPLLVEEQAMPFYPPEWIYGLFRTPTAFNWMVSFHFWLGGLGGYLLMRYLGVSSLGAWMTALATIFGAPLVAKVAAGHNSHLYGRTLMTWAPLAVLYLANRPGWWSALGLSSVFGLQLLIGVGNYQTALYTGLLVLLFGVYVTIFRLEPAKRRQFFGWGMVAALLALGIGAARLGVTLDIGLQGNRQDGLSAESVNYGSLPWLMLFGFGLPHTFDDPSITDYIWPEYAIYVGAATILLAVYAVRKRRRDPSVLFWAGITVLFLWLALGSAAGLFTLFMKLVPGYQLFRNPARQVMVAGLGISILAGYGFDWMMLHANVQTHIRRRWPYVLAIVGASLVVIVASLYQEPSNTSSFDVLPQRFLRGLVWFSAAIVAFILAIRLFRTYGTWRYAVLALVVVSVDLVSYAAPIIYSGASLDPLTYITPENLPVEDGRGFAFLEIGDSDEWGRVNVAEDSGLRFLNGYSGVLPQRMTSAINILAGRPGDEPQEENQIILDDVARPDLLDLFGVQWLLVNTDEPLPDDPSLREGRDFGPVRSVENVDAFPFAFVVPHVESVSSADEALHWLEQTGISYREQAVIEGEPPATPTCPVAPDIDAEALTAIRLEGGNLRMTIETPQAGLLIVNQTYHRGWKAWINGDETVVYAADYRWMGVYLPCAGRYEVHLRYVPPSLVIGMSITVGTLLLMIVVSTGLIIQQRKLAHVNI